MLRLASAGRQRSPLRKRRKGERGREKKAGSWCVALHEKMPTYFLEITFNVLFDIQRWEDTATVYMSVRIWEYMCVCHPVFFISLNISLDSITISSMCFHISSLGCIPNSISFQLEVLMCGSSFGDTQWECRLSIGGGEKSRVAPRNW